MHNWQHPALLDFNKWLKRKAEGLERYRVLNSKAKKEETVKPKTTKIFATNIKVTSKAQNKSKFPPCVMCKGIQALWNCVVFKEKNAEHIVWLHGADKIFPRKENSND